MGAGTDVFFQYVLPILGAAIAGAAIGWEREYRGRPAGLRTHILVALASSFLMLAAVHQMRWLSDTPADVVRIDPVRMAHGILTGIGFLCGGVIFRQGLTVHGLTTAASLWITSALGTLYGVGFYGLAVGGTVATLAVLILLRWVDRNMPKTTVVDVKVRYRRSDQMPDGEFRDLARELHMSPGVIGHRLLEEGRLIELSTTLHSSNPEKTHHLVGRLCGDVRVIEFEVTPRND
jgi:putative Mg2+ transporter-C (MgtC) family protein